MYSADKTKPSEVIDTISETDGHFQVDHMVVVAGYWDMIVTQVHLVVASDECCHLSTESTLVSAPLASD